MKASGATLHIIAGARHEYYLDRYHDRVRPDIEQSGIEIEDFVADVRPAYQRATVVVAPLVASAGTNIKIMEAMAMGKAIVSTPAGINGLDLSPSEGRDRGEYRRRNGASDCRLAREPNPRRGHGTRSAD